MRLAAAAALCALLAASTQVGADGDSPDFAHKFGLDTVRLAAQAGACVGISETERRTEPLKRGRLRRCQVKYLAERRSQAPSNLSDYYSGLKYFSRISPEPFWAVLPGAGCSVLPLGAVAAGRWSRPRCGRRRGDRRALQAGSRP
jgi:hypothetical protein